jgi:adenosylhomocysteine nucleosidase
MTGAWHLAIVSAMGQELCAVMQQMACGRRVHLAGRDFWLGAIDTGPVIAVLSGIVKVAAAMTTTLLLRQFRVGRVVFTWTAEALGDCLRVGDVVVSDGLLQHDMCGSPLFPRNEIPLLGTACFRPDPALSSVLLAPAPRAIGATTLRKFGGHAPRVYQGLVASGARFSASGEERAHLRHALPATLAAEMDDAAVALIGQTFGVAIAVLPVISDSAGDSAQADFDAFVEKTACRNTLAAVRHCVSGLRTASA